MEKYDYRRAITDDIKDWIVNDTDILEENDDKQNDELYNWVYDEIFDNDNITGNGAYYYDSEDKCSEYLSGNFNLLCEAMREFGIDNEVKMIIKHYENQDLARYFDCSIRCYLLMDCIYQAMEELQDEVGRLSKERMGSL